MSTISVALAERLDAAHREQGQAFVSAPVFGRPDLASSGDLFVLAAGDPTPVAKCRPLLNAIGQRTFPIGAEPANANLVKLSGNFLHRLGDRSVERSDGARRQGRHRPHTVSRHPQQHAVRRADLQDLRRADRRGALSSRQASRPTRAQGCAARLGAARTLQVPMPLASLIPDRFLALVAGGGDDSTGRPSPALRPRTQDWAKPDPFGMAKLPESMRAARSPLSRSHLTPAGSRSGGRPRVDYAMSRPLGAAWPRSTAGPEVP